MTLTGLLFLTAALVGCSVNGDNVQQSSPASHPQSVPLDQTDPLSPQDAMALRWQIVVPGSRVPVSRVPLQLGLYS
jgi:hypothetical protein